MKQPELGRKLASFRNERGLTQEQLSEKSNINIRTVQRIEAGEVIPRVNTLKLILEILDKNFEEINGEFEHYTIEKPVAVRIAWIAGICLAGCNMLLIAIVLFRDLLGMNDGIIHFNTIVLLIGMISLFLFNCGIIQIGKTFNNYFLVVTGYLGIVLTILGDMTQIIWSYTFLPFLDPVSRILLIMAAVNGIFYGAGLILLRKSLDDLLIPAGIIVIFMSVLLMVPVGIIALAGLIISVPSLLLQVIIFYRLEASADRNMESAIAG